MKDDKPSNIPDDQDIQDSNSKAPSGCPNHWKNQIFCDSETTEYVQGIEKPLVLSKDRAKMDIQEALSMCDAICLENPGFRNELIIKLLLIVLTIFKAVRVTSSVRISSAATFITALTRTVWSL